MNNKKILSSSAVVVVLLLLVAAGAGFYFYKSTVKSSQTAKAGQIFYGTLVGISSSTLTLIAPDHAQKSFTISYKTPITAKLLQRDCIYL